MVQKSLFKFHLRSLSLHTSRGNPFHEIFLGREEQKNQRKNRNQRHGHHLIPLNVGGDIDADPECQGQRKFGHGIDVNVGVEEVIPRPQKLEQPGGEESRLQER